MIDTGLGVYHIGKYFSNYLRIDRSILFGVVLIVFISRIAVVG